MALMIKEYKPDAVEGRKQGAGAQAQGRSRQAGQARQTGTWAVVGKVS